jgi:hypothetical protein
MRRWLPLAILAAAQFVMVLDSSVMKRDRAFGIGLAVYGLGSLTTALSPNLGVLLFGWSLVALLSLLFTRRLPGKPSTAEP